MKVTTLKDSAVTGPRASWLVLIQLFQPKADILRVVEPCTTTAGGDLKGPDKPKLASSFRGNGRYLNSMVYPAPAASQESP